MDVRCGDGAGEIAEGYAVGQRVHGQTKSDQRKSSPARDDGRHFIRPIQIGDIGLCAREGASAKEQRECDRSGAEDFHWESLSLV